MVDKENVDATEHIEECHERYQHAAYLGDCLDTTQDDGCTESCDDGSCDIR